MTDPEKTKGDEDPKGEAWDVDAIASDLRAVRMRWRAAQQHPADYGEVGFPSRRELDEITAGLCGAMFPLRLGSASVRVSNEEAFVRQALDLALRRLQRQVQLELAYSRPDGFSTEGEAARIVGGLAVSLPTLRELLDSDVEAAFTGDPAARSADEVLLSYPGVLAIIHHRLAHRLRALGAPLVARIIAELAHSQTGIDIHPGATIGHSFFIDHGTGVVIGETAIVGDRVRLYQVVTLGARSFPATEQGWLEKGLARHPIIEDDVVIYAGASLLGRITVGRGSTIGGNVWLTESVPPGSYITQARSKRVRDAPVQVDFTI